MSDYGFLIGMLVGGIISCTAYFVIDMWANGSSLLKGYSERHYANWKREKEFDNEMENTS